MCVYMYGAPCRGEHGNGDRADPQHPGFLPAGSAPAKKKMNADSSSIGMYLCISICIYIHVYGAPCRVAQRDGDRADLPRLGFLRAGSAPAKKKNNECPSSIGMYICICICMYIYIYMVRLVVASMETEIALTRNNTDF